ncbi:MAG: glycoside hydrolase family 88 protein [Pirellulales bacterium]|nr:glycoside hydrolase family 88 protein [Pirellulales bacterium]
MALSAARDAVYRRALDFAARQTRAVVEREPGFYPMYTRQGRWRHGQEAWTQWTDGFFAGLLWKLYAYTGDPWWRQQAEVYSAALEPRQHDREVHDLGFVFLNSYWPWQCVSGDRRLEAVIVQAGRTLAMRFNERGQFLRSFLAPESLFIDIMMNVPIILHAARVTGDVRLREIALAHCRTTARYLVRADGSTAHEGIFDLETGQFLRQSTQQGLRAESAWARGLAWSLYGFATVYRYTELPEFLEVSRRNAAYFVEHLPADGVPHWDFDADPTAPPPWGAQKDSSAAAIAASGLFDLAQLSGEDRWREAALQLLDALCGPKFLADQTPGWEGMLLHGVYHTGKGLGVDESVIWGDFFFVEALGKAVGLASSANSLPHSGADPQNS